MVDSTEAMESQYVTVDLVQGSTSKKLVVLDPGNYEETEHKDRRLTLGVTIDGKQKKWRPNKETVGNLNRELGKMTEEWVGKPIVLIIKKLLGKDAVVGTPLK